MEGSHVYHDNKTAQTTRTSIPAYVCVSSAVYVCMCVNHRQARTKKRGHATKKIGVLHYGVLVLQ